MYMKKKQPFFLALILLFALLLRFWKLPSIPTLNRDEAALGYNAVLLEETGRDEWQRKMPLLFESFGDFKLPGYIYTLVLVFQVFPANDFFLRLPSALAGVGLVYLSYLWGRDILKIRSKRLQLYLTLLVALMPVFTFYSRMAFEANLALTFLLGAIYLFLKEKSQVFWGTILLLLATLSYNTPYLLLPFLVILFFLLSLEKGREKLRWASGISLSIFIIFSYLFLPLTAQKSNITIFNDPGVWENYAQYRSQFSSITQTLLGNKYVYYGKLIGQNISKSFSPDFLLFHGGPHPWHSPSFWGHLFFSTYFLFFLTLPLALVTFFKKLRKRQIKIENFTIIYLLLIALAPAVVTVDAPHATRSLLFFVLFVFITVKNFDALLNSLKRQQSKILFPFFFLILLGEAFLYHGQYFYDFPNWQSQAIWPNYDQAIRKTEENFPDKNVAIIDPGGYQYILTAWYLQIPAQDFYASIGRLNPDNIHFSYGAYLTHYHFIKETGDVTDEHIMLSQNKGLELL